MDNELTRLMVQSEPHHRTGQPHKPTQIHPSNPQQQVPGQKQQIEDEINRTTQDIQHMRDRFKTK